MIPRIRGKIGVIEEPESHKGQFAFTISLWTFDGETKIGEDFGPYGPFKTEAEAQEELKKVVRIGCSAFQEDGSLPENYIDLKAGGLLRPWESQ